MHVKVERDGEYVPTDKIYVKFYNGEVITMKEWVLNEIVVNSSNDDYQMVTKPSNGNEFIIKFLDK